MYINIYYNFIELFIHNSFQFLMYILFGIPLPLGTVTILCIDLGTDMVVYSKPQLFANYYLSLTRFRPLA